MLVYDVTSEKTFDNIRNWIRNIEEVRLIFYKVTLAAQTTQSMTTQHMLSMYMYIVCGHLNFASCIGSPYQVRVMFTVTSTQ